LHHDLVDFLFLFFRSGIAERVEQQFWLVLLSKMFAEMRSEFLGFSFA
jgi:hypothetical protein